MLGFLGGIIGPVAGLLTYDNGQQIEDGINNLNQVAANLSHLVGKQTHVVRTQFEEIQGRFNIYEELQEELKNQLTEIQKGMYEMLKIIHYAWPSLLHHSLLTNNLLNNCNQYIGTFKITLPH